MRTCMHKLHVIFFIGRTLDDLLSFVFASFLLFANIYLLFFFLFLMPSNFLSLKKAVISNSRLFFVLQPDLDEDLNDVGSSQRPE